MCVRRYVDIRSLPFFFSPNVRTRPGDSDEDLTNSEKNAEADARIGGGRGKEEVEVVNYARASYWEPFLFLSRERNNQVSHLTDCKISSYNRTTASWLLAQAQEMRFGRLQVQVARCFPARARFLPIHPPPKKKKKPFVHRSNGETGNEKRNISVGQLLSLNVALFLDSKSLFDVLTPLNFPRSHCTNGSLNHGHLQMKH